MVKVSVVCLIYRSKKLADWVYDSLHEFTPMLNSGEAEFFFVANDATDDLIDHLNRKKYSYIKNNNFQYTDDELLCAGYAGPEYMSRVYKGYNKGILNAKGEMVVLINSDNFFSPDWLENLIKYSDRSNVVCSKIVERNHPKHHVFPSAYNKNFGDKPDNFKKDNFLKYVLQNKKTGLETHGAYMPCLLYKDIAIQAGLYPEGNLAAAAENIVSFYGDEEFYQKLSVMGIKHLTALDSIVYHLKEGELDEDSDEKEKKLIRPSKSNKLISYKRPILQRITLYFTPRSNHKDIMEFLTISTEGRWAKIRKKLIKSFIVTSTLNIIYKIILTLGLLPLAKKVLKMIVKK